MKRVRCPMIATALSGLVMITSATSALAQSPSVDGYDETGVSEVLPVLESPPGEARPVGLSSMSHPNQSAADRGGSRELPFTGLALPLLALLGGALVAAGALGKLRLRSQDS